MLPPDLTVENNLKKAAQILAPFLIISHHLVINFDEMDLKSALLQGVQTLMKAAESGNMDNSSTTEIPANWSCFVHTSIHFANKALTTN